MHPGNRAGAFPCAPVGGHIIPGAGTGTAGRAPGGALDMINLPLSLYSKSRSRALAWVMAFGLILQAGAVLPQPQAARATPNTTIVIDGTHEADWGAPVG